MYQIASATVDNTSSLDVLISVVDKIEGLHCGFVTNNDLNRLISAIISPKSALLRTIILKLIVVRC